MAEAIPPNSSSIADKTQEERKQEIQLWEVQVISRIFFFHTMLTQCCRRNGGVLLLLPDRLPAGLEKGTVGLFRRLRRNRQQLHCWKREAEMAFLLQRHHPYTEDVFSAVSSLRPHPAASLLQSNASLLSSGCPRASTSRCCWLRWPVLGQGARSSALLQLPSQLSAGAGWPPAGQASRRSPLGWSVARAIVLLLFVHPPQDWQLHSYGIIVASSAGNRNKAQYWP